MKIAVMGTGAMACLFGGRMAQYGHETWLVSGWKENVTVISEKGIVLKEKDREDLVVKPYATLNASDVIADGVFPDMVLVSCKGMQTEATIKRALPIIGENTSVLTLQNGMGNADVIAKYVPESQIFYGSASIASDLLGLGLIKDTTNHNRAPLISMMPYNKTDSAALAQIGALFASFGYTTLAAPNTEKNIWTKFCLNCCGNALAGITRLSNDVYSNDRNGFIMLNLLCAEAVAVANAKGVDIDYNEMRAYMHATYYSQHHFVSMAQDIHNKMPTEIDTINGYLVKEARKFGISVPYNEAMVHLIKLISSHYDQVWI